MTRASLRCLAAAAIGTTIGASAAGAATPTAQYQVRFDGTWSSTSHPFDWPPNPHFSSLIGGTHDASVHFWQPGALASQGIKDMAERGLTAPLATEVQAAIGAGHAGVVIQGGGVAVSPGVANASFSISQAFSRVSLVTMVAPSPDWFVGVESLRLFVDGEWVERITVPLYAWDAGTDCGTSYTAANCVSTPPQPIAPGASPPFTSGVAVGLMTFTRSDVYTPLSVPAASPAGLLVATAFVLVLGAVCVLRRRAARA
jgi:hypothetical protein